MEAGVIICQNWFGSRWTAVELTFAMTKGESLSPPCRRSPYGGPPDNWKTNKWLAIFPAAAVESRYEGRGDAGYRREKFTADDGVTRRSIADAQFHNSSSRSVNSAAMITPNRAPGRKVDGQQDRSESWLAPGYRGKTAADAARPGRSVSSAAARPCVCMARSDCGSHLL